MESYAIDRLSPDSQVSEHQYCPELFGNSLARASQRPTNEFSRNASGQLSRLAIQGS